MNLNSLDLNLIRVFDALLKERSVTRAGERIGLSQPAVSAALNRLRHTFNDQLFVRNGHEMVPTPRAESLAEPVRVALSALEKAFDTEGSFDPSARERTFTLLGADTFSMLFLPQFSAKLATLAPRIKLRMLDSACGDLVRLLQDGMVDITFDRDLDLPEWISSQFLFSSPLAVIARTRNSRLEDLGLSTGEHIPMERFCELKHAIRSVDGSMTGMIDEALQQAGMTRQVTLALPHFQGVAQAVASSDLIAGVPYQFARAVAKNLNLAIYRPPVDIPAHEVRMYWHARQDDEKQHAWLRSQIVALVQEMGLDRTGCE